MQAMCDGRMYFDVDKLGNLTVTGIPADSARNEVIVQGLSLVEPDRDPRGFMKGSIMRGSGLIWTIVGILAIIALIIYIVSAM